MDVYIAQQPILDSRQRVYAYELLFRSGPENYFPKIDPDMATSSLIDNSFFVMGLENLVGNKLAFINMTRASLMRELAFLLPKDSVVVEVLETVQPDDEVIEACKELKKQGYRIALDDFVHSPSFEPLLQLSDFVKVDFMISKPLERQTYAKNFIPRGLQMLAEKVENHEDVKEAIYYGYSLFQGYFFCKPEMVKGKTIPEYKLNYLRFLQELSRPDIDFNQLENIFKQEVSLSVKLLRFLNSAAMGLRQEMTSIKHALVFLGERPLKKWASLIAFTNLGSDKPIELLFTCILRARFCETLGHKARMTSREMEMFLTGMFSAIDAVVDRPLNELLDEISVPEDVRKTLLGNGSPLTPIYNLVLAYERAQWDTITDLAKDARLTEQQISDAYKDALQWAQQVFSI